MPAYVAPGCSTHCKCECFCTFACSTPVLIFIVLAACLGISGFIMAAWSTAEVKKLKDVSRCSAGPRQPRMKTAAVAATPCLLHSLPICFPTSCMSSGRTQPSTSIPTAPTAHDRPCLHSRKDVAECMLKPWLLALQFLQDFELAMARADKAVQEANLAAKPPGVIISTPALAAEYSQQGYGQLMSIFRGTGYWSAQPPMVRMEGGPRAVSCS